VYELCTDAVLTSDPLDGLICSTSDKSRDSRPVRGYGDVLDRDILSANLVCLDVARQATRQRLEVLSQHDQDEKETSP